MHWAKFDILFSLRSKGIFVVVWKNVKDMEFLSFNYRKDVQKIMLTSRWHAASSDMIHTVEKNSPGQ